MPKAAALVKRHRKRKSVSDQKARTTIKLDPFSTGVVKHRLSLVRILANHSRKYKAASSTCTNSNLNSMQNSKSHFT